MVRLCSPQTGSPARMMYQNSVYVDEGDAPGKGRFKARIGLKQRSLSQSSGVNE